MEEITDNKPKREPSAPGAQPKTKQRIKEGRNKLLFYLIVGLIFLVFLWFVLRPSGGDRQQGEGTLSLRVPSGERVEIVDDKAQAYEEDASYSEVRQELLDTLPTSAEPTGQNGKLLSPGGGGSSSFVYEDKYGSNYRPDNSYELQAQMAQQQNEVENLKYENEQLRDVIEEYNQTMNEMEAQTKATPTAAEALELYKRQKEIDYQLAEKYQPDDGPVDPSVTHPRLDEVALYPSQKNIVSGLAVPMTQEELQSRYENTKNFGFYSIDQEDGMSDLLRNAVKVEVDRTVVLKPGDYINLRLQDEVMLGQVRLPRGTRLTGVARLSGNRMKIIVSSIEYQDCILKTSLTAFDIDGQEGLYVPMTAETSAIREAAAAVAQAPASGGINFNNADAKQQILTDVARSLIKGGAGYVTKKVSEIRITVKAGHKLYLVSNKTGK